MLPSVEMDVYFGMLWKTVYSMVFLGLGLSLYLFASSDHFEPYFMFQSMLYNHHIVIQIYFYI